MDAGISTIFRLSGPYTMYKLADDDGESEAKHHAEVDSQILACFSGKTRRACISVLHEAHDVEEHQEYILL